MKFRLEHAHRLLGSCLADLWMSPAAAQRSVTCATYVQDPADMQRCVTGELIVLDGALVGHDSLLDVLHGRTRERAVGVLLPKIRLDDAFFKELREIALGGDVALGIVREGVSLPSLNTIVSRAMAPSAGDPVASKLHTADTLQSVAEILGNLVGNSVTIETPNHDLLASSATGSDVDRAREETILHRRAHHQIMEHPDFEVFLARVRTSDWPIHIGAYPDYGFSGRVAVRIASGGETYGIIWVTDTARPLGERDYAAIKQAADAAASIFMKLRAAGQREAELRTELLEDVITGRITNPENIRTVARTIGWNIDRLQAVLVVSIDNFEDFRLRHAGRSGTRLQRIKERLVEIVNLEVLAVDPDAVVGLRSTGVIVLLDVQAGDRAVRKAASIRLATAIANRVAAFLGDVTVTVGVGKDIDSIDALGESFRQAELAAQLGASLWGGNRAMHYDDLGVHRVLFALRENDEMMTPALQRIVEHDQEHHTDYVPTLAAYLKSMGRLRVAAEQLGIHRNTLEYRIGRIVELAGLDLDDPDNRLALELGIRMLELSPGK